MHTIAAGHPTQRSAKIVYNEHLTLHVGMYLKHAFGHSTELCANVVQACEKCAHLETSISLWKSILQYG